MFLERNEQYDDAFTETGVLGACTALIGDVKRLRKMVLKNPTHGKSVRENVEDKLRDIAVQAVMGLMMLSEENYDGN